MPEGAGLRMATPRPNAGLLRPGSGPSSYLPFLLWSVASMSSLILPVLVIAARMLFRDSPPTIPLPHPLSSRGSAAITVELHRASSSWSNLYTRVEIELRINSLHSPSWRAVQRKLIHSILSTWKNQGLWLISHHPNLVCAVWNFLKRVWKISCKKKNT